MTKECGDCTLCCKIMSVPELNKPKDTWCSHVVKKGGCGIYETRPHACREFRCLWLKDAGIPADWKPNKAKFLMVDESPTELVVHVEANFPGAWRKEPCLTALRTMAQQAQSLKRLVVIMERGESTVLLPDREVPIGVVGPDQRLVSGFVATPSGPRFEVKVMSLDEAARVTGAALNWQQPKV